MISPYRDEPRGHDVRPVTSEKRVTLRFGSRADEDSLARLAALDSSKPLAQPVLVAEVGGQLLAALALSDGKVVADPFHPTLALIELLRARARQLGGDIRIRRSRRLRAWSRVRAGSRRTAGLSSNRGNVYG